MYLPVPLIGKTEINFQLYIHGVFVSVSDPDPDPDTKNPDPDRPKSKKKPVNNVYI